MEQNSNENEINIDSNSILSMKSEEMEDLILNNDG